MVACLRCERRPDQTEGSALHRGGCGEQCGDTSPPGARRCVSGWRDGRAGYESRARQRFASAGSVCLRVILRCAAGEGVAFATGDVAARHVQLDRARRTRSGPSFGACAISDSRPACTAARARAPWRGRVEHWTQFEIDGLHRTEGVFHAAETFVRASVAAASDCAAGRLGRTT